MTIKLKYGDSIILSYNKRKDEYFCSVVSRNYQGSKKNVLRKMPAKDFLKALFPQALSYEPFFWGKLLYEIRRHGDIGSDSQCIDVGEQGESFIFDGEEISLKDLFEEAYHSYYATLHYSGPKSHQM